MFGGRKDGSVGKLFKCVESAVSIGRTNAVTTLARALQGRLRLYLIGTLALDGVAHRLERCNLRCNLQLPQPGERPMRLVMATWRGFMLSQLKMCVFEAARSD